MSQVYRHYCQLQSPAHPSRVPRLSALCTGFSSSQLPRSVSSVAPRSRRLQIRWLARTIGNIRGVWRSA